MVAMRRAPRFACGARENRLWMTIVLSIRQWRPGNHRKLTKDSFITPPFRH
jgi:hypothetical protein